MGMVTLPSASPPSGLTCKGILLCKYCFKDICRKMRCLLLWSCPHSSLHAEQCSRPLTANCTLGTTLTHGVHRLHVVHKVPFPQVDGQLEEPMANGNNTSGQWVLSFVMLQVFGVKEQASHRRNCVCFLKHLF